MQENPAFQHPQSRADHTDGVPPCQEFAPAHQTTDVAHESHDSRCRPRTQSSLAGIASSSDASLAEVRLQGAVMATIDYYFSLLSPWAYIGHAPFMEIVRRHGVTVRYKPVALAQVFTETGGLPLPKRHPARQRYRMFELQRWREKRGLNFHLKPQHWPFDPRLADGVVLAAQEAGLDLEPFVTLAFKGAWEDQLSLVE